MILGLLKGGIFIFILLTLLVPAVNLAEPVMTSAITEQLKSSFFAKILYDNNYLMEVLKTFFK